MKIVTRSSKEQVNLTQDPNIVLEQGNWVIYKPTSYKEACNIASGIKWGFILSEKLYNIYADDENLYIMLNLLSLDIYSYHPLTQKILDQNNKSLSIAQFIKGIAPELKDFIEQHKLSQAPRTINSGGHYIYNEGIVPSSIGQKIKTASVADGVTEIEQQAFRDCTSLTSIEISSSVTTIGEWAFCHCNNLKKVTMPSRFKPRQSLIFTDCNKIEFIYV